MNESAEKIWKVEKPKGEKDYEYYQGELLKYENK